MPISEPLHLGEPWAVLPGQPMKPFWFVRLQDMTSYLLKQLVSKIFFNFLYTYELKLLFTSTLYVLELTSFTTSKILTAYAYKY